MKKTSQPEKTQKPSIKSIEKKESEEKKGQSIKNNKDVMTPSAIEKEEKNNDQIFALTQKSNNVKKKSVLEFFMNASSQIYDKTKKKIETFSEKITINIKSENSKEDENIKFLQKNEEKHIVEAENKNEEKIENCKINNKKTEIFFEKKAESLTDKKTKIKLKKIKQSLTPEKQPEKIISEEELERIQQTKLELLEAEKQKILLEQKIRDVDKEIKSLEENVFHQESEEENERKKRLQKLEQENKELMAQAQAAELIKKLNKNKQEREIIKNQQKEVNDRNFLEKIEMEKKFNEEKKEIMKFERLKKIQEKLTLIQKQKQERKLVEEKSKILIKESKKNYYKTIQQINQRVDKDLNLPELERKKKDLESRRNIYKPLDREEIETHAQKYENLKNKNILEKKKRLKELSNEKPDIFSDLKKLESGFTKKVIEMDENTKKQSDKSKSERIRLFKTKNEYTKLVKEQFKPRIDENKRKEIQMRMESKSKSKERKKDDTLFADSLIQKIEEGDEQDGKATQANTENALTKLKKLKLNYPLPWKKTNNNTKENLFRDSENNHLSTNIEANKNSKKYDNYLEAIKKDRENQPNNHAIHKKWQKLLKDEKMDNKEKYMVVMNDAILLENQAKLKEELIGKQRKTDIQTQEQINELYLDSIKAKLALLSNATG